MFSTLVVVLYFAFRPSVVAQSSLSVVCVAGQCLQGFSNTTIGAKLSAPGAATSVHLLPGQYTSTTNPQLLHSLLTSSSATLTTSPGFGSASASSLPLNLALEPGLVIYSQSLYSGQSAFSELPSAPIVNTSTPLTASSIALSNNIWAAVTSGSNNLRIVLWDAIPDISQLPSGASSSLSLVDIQSSACSPPCSGSGVCSASGTCTCPTGFTGSACETCAEDFFGPTCQPCPEGCASCDQGISGSGRCLIPLVANAPSTCNCLNGQCGANGECACNPGWTNADNGTACAKCASDFFLNTAGDCQVCQLGCDQCADGTATCISCKQGFTQDANDKSKCDPLPSTTTGGVACPDGSFSSGAQCSPCSPSCRTCIGPSSNDCVICATGQYLFNGSCVGANTDGVCEGTNGMIADNNKHECDSCGSKCTSCRIPNFSIASTVNQLQCTGCLPGFVLSQGKCVESCPSGTFVSLQDNLTCTPCSSSCATCTGSADFCLTCAGGQLASSGQCVSSCPSNTFSSSGSCLKCHPDCASCSGPSFNQCSTCPLERPVVTSGRCLPTCTKSQYFDKTSSSCQTCDSSCSSCSGPGPSNCLACSSSTQVLRAGSCESANCNGASNVIPGLGVCLSELVQVPNASGTDTASPLPSITGLGDPTVVNTSTRRPLEWWQILLMALGCAFIFVVFLLCWRRRARKQRAKRTKIFATVKKLDNHGWRWRLARFGERLFGHRAANRLRRGQPGVLPVAFNHHDHYHVNSRPQSVVSEYSQDIKMKKMNANANVKEETPRSKRETVDEFIDAYNYSTHSRSSRAPSTLPGLEDRRYNQRQNQQRRIEQESLYAEVTGNARHTPEPRQPLKRELSSVSRFSRSTVGSGLRRNLTGTGNINGTREGVLVDLDDDEARRVPPPPLQMVTTTETGTGSANRSIGMPTDAQAYMMAVRPGLVGAPQPNTGGGSSMEMGMGMGMGPIGATAATGGSFMPIPVTLTPNTTMGQGGSYWLSPVVPHQTGGSSLQLQFQPSPQQQHQIQQQYPSVDTVVLQPMNTGGSVSRNPFRQGSY